MVIGCILCCFKSIANVLLTVMPKDTSSKDLEEFANLVIDIFSGLVNTFGTLFALLGIVLIMLGVFQFVLGLRQSDCHGDYISADIYTINFFNIDKEDTIKVSSDWSEDVLTYFKEKIIEPLNVIYNIYKLTFTDDKEFKEKMKNWYITNTLFFTSLKEDIERLENDYASAHNDYEKRCIKESILKDETIVNKVAMLMQEAIEIKNNYQKYLDDIETAKKELYEDYKYDAFKSTETYNEDSLEILKRKYDN